MKTTFPIAQPGKSTSTIGHPLQPGRKGDAGTDFNSALAQQGADRESAVNAATRALSDGHHDLEEEAGDRKTPRLADGRAPRPNGKFEHQLHAIAPSMSATETADLSEEVSIKEPSLPESAPEATTDEVNIGSVSALLSDISTLNGLSNQHAPSVLHSVIGNLPRDGTQADPNGGSTAQNLDIPASDKSHGAEFSHQARTGFRLEVGHIVDGQPSATSPEPIADKFDRAEIAKKLLAAPGSVNPENEKLQTQAKSGSLDRDISVSDLIKDTPMTIRKQETHFAREPVGRIDPLRLGTTPTSIAPPTRNELMASVPKPARPSPLAKSIEAAQVAHQQSKIETGQLTSSPVESSAPAVQVLGKILEACHDVTSFAASPASAPTLPSTDRPFGPMIRLIRLELSPASLGVVQITLKGANATLSLSIEAEQSQTAMSLSEDRAVLSSRLKDAGYTLSDLVVSVLDRPLDAAPSLRSDQPSASSSNTLTAGTGNTEHRHASDGQKQSKPESDTSQKSEGHNASLEEPTKSTDPLRAPSATWRGRHRARSV